MSGPIKYVCTKFTSTQQKGKGISVFKRGDVVDGDDPIIAARPDRFRPLMPQEQKVSFGWIHGPDSGSTTPANPPADLTYTADEIKEWLLS